MEKLKGLVSKKTPEKLTEKEGASVENLKEPIKKILETLKTDIDEGTYNLIIGDDASGRIPTRIIARVLQEVSRRKGVRPPIVRFIAGSTSLASASTGKNIDKWSDKHADVSKQVGKMQDTLIKNGYNNGKALIVTDSIKHGRSINVLIEGLHDNGISGDVATIGLESENPQSWGSHLAGKWEGKLVWGMVGTPTIYTEGKKLSGVRKESDELFAKPDEAGWFYRPASLEKQHAARDRADEVAEEILKEMFP